MVNSLTKELFNMKMFYDHIKYANAIKSNETENSACCFFYYHYESEQVNEFFCFHHKFSWTS